MRDNPVSANYVMGKSIYESGQARKEEFCNSRALANLSYYKCDVVLLFTWIELANVRYDRVNQGCRRECAMTVQ